MYEIDQVHDEMIALIAASSMSWLKTPDAAEVFSSSFGLRKIEGKANKKYIVRDGMNNSREVNHDDVSWFYTAFVKGKQIDPESLEEESRPVLFCDACGMGGYCPIEVRDRETGQTKMYCNHCLVSQEDPNLKVEGDSKKCLSCPAVSCDYHPVKYSGGLRSIS